MLMFSAIWLGCAIAFGLWWNLWPLGNYEEPDIPKIKPPLCLHCRQPITPNRNGELMPHVCQQRNAA